MNQDSIQKLAEIQEKLIKPALDKKINRDIVIKIRDGVIVFSESLPTNRKRLMFTRVIINS
jgi:hypothetical protein